MTAIYALALAAFLPAAGTIPRQELPAPTPVLVEFLVRVADYVEVRREVAAGMGGPVFCSDPEELTRQAADLAAAIRDARPLAREGTIFTPRVAVFLRARIAHTVRVAALDVTTSVGDDDVVLDVHALLPWGAGRRAWPVLVEALPGLPQELEYRFVGRHLVLLDAEANLVVDVLRDALPEDVPGATIRSNGSCDVHPELPACWM
jgi:hypothetical protein